MNDVYESIHVVWFKRDLRVHDHALLAEATRRGSVLPLYICEPSVMHADDFSPHHWTFIRESLCELRASLAALGQPLVVRIGEAVDVLERLHQIYTVDGLWAHEETRNTTTYERDRAVRHWAKAHRIAFTELPQHGVVRRLTSRDAWAGHWEQRMRVPQISAPSALPPIQEIDCGSIPTHAELDLEDDMRVERQKGGAAAAHDLLTSFLRQRGQNYTRDMSSPLSAWDACSRLSAHIAWGTISHKTIVQTARAQASAIHILFGNRFVPLLVAEPLPHQRAESI